MIGKKRMKDGGTSIISDAVYSSYEGVINRYIQAGIIKVEQLGGSLEQLHAPSPTPPAPPEPTVENKSDVVEINIIGDEPKEDTITIQMQEDVVPEQVIAVTEEPVVEEVVVEETVTEAVVASAEEPSMKATKKKPGRKPRRKKAEA
tara:strand:+ start:873 stop:1313 length:441 start_codon:yes stop_codon:yes gene_type:complete